MIADFCLHRLQGAAGARARSNEGEISPPTSECFTSMTVPGFPNDHTADLAGRFLREAAQQAERAGVRMEARRAETR